MKSNEEIEFDDIGPEYKMLKKIGAGAYSSVWDAIHIASGRKVAIKREAGVFEDLVDCKRLLREIKLLRRLQQANIVKLIEVLISPLQTVNNFDTIYLVLEIADASLSNLIRSKIYLDPKQIRKIVYNMMVGLSYVHSAGVLHRDLKPGNVLVNKDCSVRVCDFGLARSIVGIGERPAAAKMPQSAAELSSSSSSEESDEEDKKTEVKKTRKSIKARVSISAAATQDVASFASTTESTSSEKMSDLPPTEERKAFTRRLTTHVVTRWYRAPEIILMQENYGTPIDVWSAGCIFAELLSMVKENTPSMKDRKPLFPGTSCLLLSPFHAKTASGGRSSILSVSSTDQICMIIDVLGSPSEEDQDFIKDPNVLDFLKMLPNQPNKMNFTEKYPAAGKDALDLLKRMLTFNPNHRIKVDECLAHPYFTVLRSKASEVKSPTPVSLDFENEGELTEKRLRELFGEEIVYYKKQKSEGKVLM